jgi:hypothetical protein
LVSKPAVTCRRYQKWIRPGHLSPFDSGGCQVLDHGSCFQRRMISDSAEERSATLSLTATNRIKAVRAKQNGRRRLPDRRCLRVSLNEGSRTGPALRLRAMTLHLRRRSAYSTGLTACQLTALERVWEVAGLMPMPGYEGVFLVAAVSSDSGLVKTLSSVDLDDSESRCERLGGFAPMAQAPHGLMSNHSFPLVDYFRAVRLRSVSQ